MTLNSARELDETAIDRMRTVFLTRVPEFGVFTDHDSRYSLFERAYKDELCALCHAELPRELFVERGDTPAEDIAGAALRVLTRRLTSSREPQNLVGWRYFDFLRHLVAPERPLFASAFGDLLYGHEAPSVRVERFTMSMWPTYRRTGPKNPLAQARMFPTFFLMLMNPETNIAVRTDMFDTAARELVGKRVLQNAPFSAAEYEDVLALAHGVRAQLEAWAWCPRDMIDVHSFLWIATRESYGGIADGEEA